MCKILRLKSSESAEISSRRPCARRPVTTLQHTQQQTHFLCTGRCARAADAHFLRFQHLARLGHIRTRLQSLVIVGLAVKSAEEIIVRAGDDMTASRDSLIHECIGVTISPVVAGPRALEFVEDAIVLVQRTQFATQVLVHWVRFHRRHVLAPIPYLHSTFCTLCHLTSTNALSSP